MSRLTIETMDKINFLLTEVSLECLGNKFFDIYGNQTESLLNLVSVSSLRPNVAKSASDSKLLKTINIDPFKYENARKVQLPKIPVCPVSRKRRMSLSDKDKSKEIQRETESLLVPMIPPKSAKISNRRQTINISQPQVPRFREPNRFIILPSKPLTISELKLQLKRDINERINFMRIQAESEERKYRRAHPRADPNVFFKDEEKNLFAQCNTLIQFIKLLQTNPDNALKLKNISHVIMELQKEF